MSKKIPFEKLIPIVAFACAIVGGALLFYYMAGPIDRPFHTFCGAIVGLLAASLATVCLDTGY